MDIYVQIDMHQWYASSYFTNLKGVPGVIGHGFPIWLVERYDNSAEGQRDFWNDFWNDRIRGYEGEAWHRFSQVWRKVAERYRDYPQIVGYDVFNEPYLPATCYAQLIGDSQYVPSQDQEWKLNGEILPRFYEFVMERIRSVDPKHILFFEGQDGDGKPTLRKPNIQNIVLSIHLHSSTNDYSELKEKADLGIDKAKASRFVL